MTDIAPIPPDDDDDLLAAEFVTGLLALADWNAASDRQRREPAFAARVADWENRFAELNDDYAEAPAPNLMPQIEARLFPKPAPTRGGVLNLLWAVAALASAAMAVVAFLLLSPTAPGLTAPSLTATLTADAGAIELRYEAVITGDQLTLTRVAGSNSDATHSQELWVIAGNNPPVSLGVITGDHVTIPLSGAVAGALLAITLEQPGGSSTGAPQGPIIAKGALVAL